MYDRRHLTCDEKCAIMIMRLISNKGQRMSEVIELDTPLVAQIEQQLSEWEGVQVTCAHLHIGGYCVGCQD